MLPKIPPIEKTKTEIKRSIQRLEHMSHNELSKEILPMMYEILRLLEKEKGE
jgi:hypothetical protein